MNIAEENTQPPICPYCKSEMVIAKYIGYYSGEFKYWKCICLDEDLPNPEAVNVFYGSFT